jgi:hypothetical protein
VLAPAELVDDELAGPDDLADRAAVHRLAELVGRRVGGGVVHPPAHVRVDAHEHVAHEQPAVARLGQLDLGQLEVLRHGLAVRAPRKSYLPAPHGPEH